MNAVAAPTDAPRITHVFTVFNVRACDIDDAKKVARRIAAPSLIGLPLQAYAKHESNGTYTVEFR